MTDTRNKHILVDLDRTLAYYESGDYDKYGALHIGPPLRAMVKRVKGWLAEGREVRIFTARVAPPFDTPLPRIIEAIQDWTERHIGQRLTVTYKKDRDSEEIWDDRAVMVVPNLGMTGPEQAEIFRTYGNGGYDCPKLPLPVHDEEDDE